LRTVHLAQVTYENADRLVEALDKAGIAHWEKRSGTLTRFFFAGDCGVRVFVDAARIEEAEAILDRVVPDR
jgi:hypothetical protein